MPRSCDAFWSPAHADWLKEPSLTPPTSATRPTEKSEPSAAGATDVASAASVEAAAASVAAVDAASDAAVDAVEAAELEDALEPHPTIPITITAESAAAITCFFMYYSLSFPDCAGPEKSYAVFTATADMVTQKRTQENISLPDLCSVPRFLPHPQGNAHSGISPDCDMSAIGTHASVRLPAVHPPPFTDSFSEIAAD